MTRSRRRARAVVRAAVAARGTDAHVDEPFGAERQNLRPLRASTCRIPFVRGQDEAPVRAILALPVREPALGRSQRRHPQLFTCRRVKRDEDASNSGHVHYVFDDERVENEPVRFSGHRIKPRALELRDVPLVDLCKRGVLHGVGRAAVLIPCGVGRRLLCQRDSRGEAGRQSRDADEQPRLRVRGSGAEGPEGVGGNNAGGLLVALL